MTSNTRAPIDVEHFLAQVFSKFARRPNQKGQNAILVLHYGLFGPLGDGIFHRVALSLYVSLFEINLFFNQNQFFG